MGQRATFLPGIQQALDEQTLTQLQAWALEIEMLAPGSAPLMSQSVMAVHLLLLLGTPTQGQTAQ